MEETKPPRVVIRYCRLCRGFMTEECLDDGKAMFFSQRDGIMHWCHTKCFTGHSIILARFKLPAMQRFELPILPYHYMKLLWNKDIKLFF